MRWVETEKARLSHSCRNTRARCLDSGPGIFAIIAEAAFLAVDFEPERDRRPVPELRPSRL